VSTPAWEECRRAIAATPAYRGLDLAPQRALEPLRADPASGLWEFWHVPSGARPVLDDTGAWIVTEETGLVLVLLPGGAFDMGATKQTDPLSGPECEPITRVVLDPYFISKYEMTQAQWMRVHLANPSHAQVPRVGTDDRLRPVEKISWRSARQTLAKLGLVLPTEAQWEYACRGGTSTVWASGDTRADQQAWANLADDELRGRGGPSGWDYEPWNDGQRDTCAIGHFRANGFGLHDVHGNVMEWVAEDCFPEYELPPRRGDGLRSGKSTVHPEFNQVPHVARGGGWQTTAARSRSSHRYGVREPLSEAIGIRPARPMESAP
jgi:formylglycine-generating enzyme required for sulfatase activity